MHRLFLAAALGLAGATAAHAGIDVRGSDCNLHSDYSLTVDADRLEFKREHGTPASVVVADGTLRVDGRRVDVDAADRRRLIEIERGVRDTVPEVKGIAREAIAIALDAVTEVSAAFARDPQAARASAERLARAGRELDRRLADNDRFDAWSDGDVDRLAESIAGTLVGEIAGNVAGQAIAVAFSGDEKAAAELEARANALEAKVERAVERRSKDLERRAEGLCPRLRALARIESELDVRLDDGRRLELVRVEH
ncbi:DUF2884 family protein [Dokdonella sp.]|uniref:DUF2884 family protein n=1 Tax=Dokdonella sp. TaxID=2291710 RepID=UPI001B06052B|nr:DUF2884 family protein [Dokdonella sp.]MBO9664441.1 DUF2884 family protein [Dokdonella sp.]